MSSNDDSDSEEDPFAIHDSDSEEDPFAIQVESSDSEEDDNQEKGNPRVSNSNREIIDCSTLREKSNTYNCPNNHSCKHKHTFSSSFWSNTFTDQHVHCS